MSVQTLHSLPPAERRLIEAHYTDLLAFTKTSYPQYQVGSVHRVIADKLQSFTRAVERKESPRLMIFMPPRMGKSFLASERYPAWHLGRNPMHRIIASSYSSDLASKFSKRVRRLLNEEWYQAIYPARLAADSSAVGDWETAQGGGYRAAGVGSGISGMGADILIVDDPVKDAKEARSAVYREAVWDWYNSTAYTRLMPGGGVIVIMTRWNLDDLAGRLLQSDGWDVVKFPAISEAGEALHPERYSLEYLLSVKEQIGAYNWNALYQQEPIADEHMPFKVEDFPFVQKPRDASAWDFTYFGDVAYTKKAGDDTAFGLCGISKAGERHLFESFRGKVNERDSLNFLFSKMREFQPLGAGAKLEAHSSYHYAVRERMKADNFYFPYEELKHKGESKADRILARRAYLHVWTYDPATRADVNQHLGWSPDLDGTVPDDFIDMLAYADRELRWKPFNSSDYEFIPEPETMQAEVWRVLEGIDD